METNIRNNIMCSVRRIVIKVGTSTITYSNGKLNFNIIKSLVSDMMSVINQDIEIVLVSSGAVGAGMGKLELDYRPTTIQEKQATAAVGQGVLVHTYEKIFESYGKIVGQVLLTRSDIADRTRYLNARNTLTTLLNYNVVPIVNENDTVAVEEIQFGDNDRLSALVAGLIDSQLLIILTDTEGLYTCDPRKNNDAKLIPLVKDINEDIKCVAGSEGSKFGTGGMETKIEAGRIAMHSGIPMVVANGSKTNVLQSLINGENIGTLFLPNGHNLHAKKRWIGFGSTACGKIIVDQGAEQALVEEGKSLLPSGVIRAEGSFVVGNVVSIVNLKGREIGRGIVNYTESEVERIKGKHTGEIEVILGYRTCPEIIHRDNLTVTV